MTKPVIAVDVDEVLFPFIDEFINYHNYRYGTKLNKENFTSYDFDKILDLSASETVDRVYSFLGSLKDSSTIPIDQSKNSIAVLASHFELCIVTARHAQFEQITLDWLDQNFHNCFRSIAAIGHAPIMDKPISKAKICQEINAIALIDDSLIHVNECVAIGLEGILFGNYLWNQTPKLPKNVTRCENWPAVLKHFNVV